MKAAEHNHAVPSEELMAYLDGELEPERALAVHAHLAGCESCEALAAELRQVSRDVAQWSVAPLEQPMTAPAMPVVASLPRRSAFQWMRTATAWQFAGAAAVVVVGTALWMALATGYKRPPTPGVPAATGVASARGVQAMPIERAVEGQSGDGVRLESARDKGRALEVVPPPSASNARQIASGTTNRPQKIIRTVNMTIVANEFDTVREAIDRLLRDVGGFVGTVQASDVSSERSVRATLRVPVARLDETVRALRTLGRVVVEGQSGEDVTEQVRDIEARLKNSRNTEQRLTDVLRTRTGRVADILEVEREIARVREEIERMDAQRLNFERQVEYLDGDGSGDGAASGDARSRPDANGDAIARMPSSMASRVRTKRWWPRSSGFSVWVRLPCCGRHCCGGPRAS